MDYRGIRVFYDVHLATREQVNFPRSKKRRIRKKFSKDMSNYALVPMRVGLWINNSLVCHPNANIEKLKIIEVPELSPMLYRNRKVEAPTVEKWRGHFDSLYGMMPTKGKGLGFLHIAS
jgi:hypothetical protein